MIESVDFEIGEKKKVSISIKSMCHHPFEVIDAVFILSLGDEIELSGDCEIERIFDDEIVLSALIQPQANKALYTLEYTYTIFPETFKYIVNVRVS